MGEAKRRQIERKKMDEAIGKVDFGRVASAVQRLTRAASANYGSDCTLQSMLAQSILTRLGVKSDICVGFVAWRVGDGDGDVISHLPVPGYEPSNPRELPFHTWLTVGNNIFDVTTDMEEKAARLDALDGGKTTVDWTPPYLLLPYDQVATYKDVAQKQAGLAYYERDAKLERLVLSEANSTSLDPDDVDRVWLLYENPDIKTFGPNDLK